MEEINKVLELSGLKELNPVQKKALKPLSAGESLVVAAPTASGKTLIAEMAALKTVREGKKAVYIVPLKALASEKYEEFKVKYGPLGIRIAISIGDLDASDPWLAKYDLIIVTSERFDSLLRHGIHWANSIGLVIVDEIHLLNDPGRGPTLEILLTRLRQLQEKPKILGLSATINNYKELASWLEARPVKSDYRPVKLYTGVCFDGKVHYVPKKSIELEGEEHSLLELAKKTLKTGKQALVFINTRRSSESTAEKLGGNIKAGLSPKEMSELMKLSQKILHLDHNTKQCERLAKCLRMGTAFHHAGLTNKQRALIEKSFRERKIKIICATPTLAAGINIPAYQVIIRDLKRFSSFYGMDFIPILEIQQMAGRAGRPKYDKEGEAILLAKDRSEAEYAWENYIKGNPEDIKSKLGVEPVLRTHVLALIASGVTPSKQALLDFFFNTFYALQYKDLTGIESILDRILQLLAGFEFIKGVEKTEGETPFKKASSLNEDVKLEATLIGKRVSELYIDPLTANHLIENLKKDQEISHFSILQLISHTMEMQPLMGIRKQEFEIINQILLKEGPFLLDKPPNEWEPEYDDYLRSIKTALVFQKWTQEYGEDKLLEDYGITPGELRVRITNADWLLYATQELALLLGLKSLLKDIRKSRLRVKYGIRAELLPLIKLKGVGRVRARNLFSNNIKTLDSLRKIPVKSLELIVGPKTAREIKEQL